MAPRRPDVLRGKAFRGSTAVREGHLTPGELRSTAWRRLFRDVYVCGTVAVTHSFLAHVVARIVLPGAVVSGRSAAVLWGVGDAGVQDAVEVTVPANRSRSVVPGIRVRRADLAAAAVTTRRGVPITGPAVTAVELAAATDLDDGVVILDRFVAAGLVPLTEVRARAAAMSGRGCRQVREAADLADGLAGSPQETRLRLLLHRSALPTPVAQFTVRDGAGFVARVDFAWPQHRVIVEYDGLWHRDPAQFVADRRRLNRLTAAGWRVIFVTAEDLRRPARLLARLAAELGVARER